LTFEKSSLFEKRVQHAEQAATPTDFETIITILRKKIPAWLRAGLFSRLQSA